MEENGYSVEVNSLNDLSSIKAEYQIPAELQSCHTAIVDGYIVEGHVPADTVDRLLSERPDIYGVAVPGMPTGSPGMESDTGEIEPYDVYVFDASGPLSVYDSYGY